jgi:CRISPR-associated endonuclease/helicase Cas3
VDALDELSNSPNAGLNDHLAAVGELAARIARAVGLPEPTAEALNTGGRLHDLGKADPRFQRWLGNSAPEPAAKSLMAPAAWQGARVAAGWPRGARHELLSGQLLNALTATGLTLPDPDLVRHLVLTHHGHGRPSCPTTRPAPIHTAVTLDDHGVTAVTDPGDADWDQPERFQRLCEQYGYWGLALLEAILRQADHRVSAATEVI